MTFIAPWFLLGGAVAALAVAALHLIMHRRPTVMPFPTARFIPPGTARAVRRAMRPDDLPLLALRAVMLMLLGAALARPVATPERRASARIVVLDRSRALGRIEEARDSAQALLAEGDLLVVFDSVARWHSTAPDAIARIDVSTARGNLSAALVSAVQAAPLMRDRADSIEIVIVSPAVREELDAATLAVRGTWPGRIRLIQVAADTSTLEGLGDLVDTAVGASADDPVAAGVSLWGLQSRRARLTRVALTPDDSAWARRGGAVVHWQPDRAMHAWSTSPTANAARGDNHAVDSTGAVVTMGAVVVAAFARSADPPDAFASPAATPVAWWADGRAAAVELALGAGCIREVAIDVPVRGDLVLRPSFRRLLHSLTEQCGGQVDRERLGDAALATLAGDGPLAHANALPIPDRRSPLAPWLLAVAVALAVAEPLLRRRQAQP